MEGLAPDYVRHCQAMPPDLCEGDYVAWRSRARGTMTGAMGEFPATGEEMDLVIMGMHRFEEGRITESWTAWDNVAVLSQLGLMPGD